MRRIIFGKPDTENWLKDWSRVLFSDQRAWNEAKKRALTGPEILIATSTGGHPVPVIMDSILAVALTLRGANVHLLLCDKFLDACQQCDMSLFRTGEDFLEHGPVESLCRKCFGPGSEALMALGLQIHFYSELVTSKEKALAHDVAHDIDPSEIANYQMDGLSVGEHAMAGALRFFARGTFDGEPLGEPVLRRYVCSSILSALAMRRLFATRQFEVAVLQHGIYVPHGLIVEAAKERGVRPVVWNPGYRRRSFVFSHGDTYHHTMLDEPTEKWDEVSWTEKLEQDLTRYLKSRWHGTADWIWFHEDSREDVGKIFRELGVDDIRPKVGLLTNVFWDAQLHYPANAFGTMLDWLISTVDYFSDRPELQLLIRVHPAEIRGTLVSRQPITTEIKRVRPNLPENVYIIPAESRLSTYAALERCNAAIIYGTKMGVELSAMGIPVIVAGEAWVRNKGITIDVSSPDQYFDALSKLPFPRELLGLTLERAKKYAYHFFFRRMIPLKSVKPTPGWPPFVPRICCIGDLDVGKDKGLDIICEGILRGSDFIYPAEEFDEHDHVRCKGISFLKIGRNPEVFPWRRWL